MNARAKRGFKGRRLLVHAMQTWPDGWSKGVSVCGMTPASGWSETSNDVDCQRCLDKMRAGVTT